MAIRILSSENITGNITLYHPSNAPYINFVENADTSDSKARITMDQVDTNNGTLLFATENAGTLYNQVKITQTGNLLLSDDAASFNTSNAKLNVLPASSGVYQQWNYSPSNENFSLKLKETVTSGNVRYVFEQINNSTTYANTLVFNQGKIGIGIQEPTKPLSVFAGDGAGNIILTRTGTSENLTLSTYFMFTDGNAQRVGTTSGHSFEVYSNNTKRYSVDLNGGFEFQGAEAGTTGIRFQGSGTCNGYAGSVASFYVMDVMRDQGSGKSMNVQGTIDIADGYGIGFGASAGSGATGTLLNDYEEGTWTPAIYYQNSTDAGNATNTTQTGVYTKIGNKVFVQFRLIWTITGTPATDNIGIQGIPFTAQSISNNATYAEVPCILKGYTNPTTGGRGSLTMTLPTAGQNKALFNDSNMIGNMGAAIGTGTHEIRFSFTYTTDQ